MITGQIFDNYDNRAKMLTNSAMSLPGQRSQNPQDLLQGQDLQEAHPAQGHPVQGWQGMHYRHLETYESGAVDSSYKIQKC